MENLAIVQRIYQAFATGDIQTILKLMTDDTGG
jgi:ketosteroid isomerase-like protein